MNASHNTSGSTRRFGLGRVTPFLVAVCMTLVNMPARAAVALPDVPLFVLSAGKPNVLMMLDNSQSMDEDPAGHAVGGSSPQSKSVIARSVIKGIVTTYTDKINMGLMSYKQNAPAAQFMYNSPYDAGYDPANYDPKFVGARDSLTKAFRSPNPTSPGDWVYYNVSLPFYDSVNLGNWFCYSATSKFDNSTAGDSYRCFHTKKGTSNALPTNPPTELAAGYDDFFGKYAFFPTDSDLAQNIHDFGRFLVFFPVSTTWFGNDSPGRGFLNVPVKILDASQAAAINAKLDCNIPGTPVPCTKTAMRNFGLTPMEGMFNTAQDYFGGKLIDKTEGFTNNTYPLPITCKHNYVVFVTDGLPNVDKAGKLVADPKAALDQAAAAVAALKATGVTTYIIGFALPFGTDPASLDKLAAAGGTGTSYLATDKATLDAALNTIFLDIDTKEGSGGAVATNSTQLSTDTLVFKATFKPGPWSGTLEAFGIDPDTKTVNAVAAWSASVPVFGSRTILTWDGSAGATFPTPPQLATLTAPIADYIRGDRSNENTFPYRKRESLLGDIIDSSPQYVEQGSTKTVYVGANDGMLHAFDAITGNEVFAYVPASLDFTALKTLATAPYSHRYFVDGELAVSNTTQTPGKRILIGLLGRGGKAVYALDVTNPASPTVLWEKSVASDPVTMANFGNAVGKPVIAVLNNGATGVIIGNGYNSISDHSSLFVLDINTGAVIQEIDTKKGSPGSPNGMASPKGWDADSNGTVDFVYAGDLLGNVWEFDLSDSQEAKWGSLYMTQGKPSPFFIAKDPSDVVQPITGGMTVGLDPNTFKRWVFFGTGRYLTLSDIGNLQTQSWYGLIDDGAAIPDRSVLKQRKLVVQQIQANGTPVRAFEPAVGGDMIGKQGWYVDWLDVPGDIQKGERIVSDSALFSNVLLVASIIPNNVVCAAGGKGYINAIDPFTGASLGAVFFDVNHDGSFDKSGNNVVQGNLVVGSIDLGVDMPSIPAIINNLLVAGGSKGNIGSVGVNNPGGSGRISWREVVGD